MLGYLFIYFYIDLFFVIDVNDSIRSTETTMTGSDWKFTVVQRIVLHPSFTQIISPHLQVSHPHPYPLSKRIFCWAIVKLVSSISTGLHFVWFCIVRSWG